MNFFNFPSFDSHEHLSFFHDSNTGLHAIVAIHRRGKKFAVGGTRMKPYINVEAALDDALRLSKAMTYKLALAGIPLGGGKSVIIADPKKEKSPEILSAFASFIDRLGGSYCCAPDVGTSPNDMLQIRQVTPYVRGLQEETGDSSVDTAIGVFHAIRAAVRYRLSRETLKDVRIAIQGVGNVGKHLFGMLISEGAIVTVADISDERVSALGADSGRRVVGVDDILLQDVDVVAPCALGSVISSRVIDNMKAKVICGAANNQLESDDLADYLDEKGILYVPDYLANAGGVIGGCRIDCEYSEKEARQRIEGIYDTCLEVFERSEMEKRAMPFVANLIAEGRMKELL